MLREYFSVGFGSTDFGNEKIFDPLALVSQLTTKFYGLKVCSEFLWTICSHPSHINAFCVCFPLLYQKQN
jgi:hypothetical protein